MSRLNVMVPYLGEEEVAAVSEVLRSGWVAQGPKVAAFESPSPMPCKPSTRWPSPRAPPPRISLCW